MLHNKQDKLNKVVVLMKSNKKWDFKNVVRTQGTLLSALWRPKWGGNLKKYIYIYDSLCYTAAHCKTATLE